MREKTATLPDRPVCSGQSFNAHPFSAMNLSASPADFATISRRSAFVPRSRGSSSRPTAGTISPTLHLAAECAREVAASHRVEATTLLFLAGCAAAVLVGCGLQIERCVAHWESFETFVRAMLG